VSTTRRRQRSRKLSATARKLRQKVLRGSGFAARHGVVHVVDAPPSQASGVTLHLTQLQWQHSQMDAGNVICDEAWYDSVSMLEDSADPESDFGDEDDDPDNDYASVSGDPLPDVAGVTNGSSPCTDAACLADTVRRLGNIADAEACQGDPPERSEDSDVVAGGGLREPQSATSCSPRPFPGSVPSNKVQPMPMPMPVAGFSPHHQRKKSAVVKLSYRRRSYEGDEMTEMSGSAKYLYRPRAGLTLPCSTGEKLSEGCWSDLEPSVFRVRGEGFFR